MANYYTDHPEFEFHLNHPLMKRIVELKERNFADKQTRLLTIRTLSRTIRECWKSPATSLPMFLSLTVRM